MLVAGKKIVVVGGSSGIGLATAEMARRVPMLAETGWRFAEKAGAVG